VLRGCGRFERATPDFQAKLGYEVDKPGQADMTIASNAVRRRPARAALPHAPLQRHLRGGLVWTCGYLAVCASCCVFAQRDGQCRRKPVLGEICYVSSAHGHTQWCASMPAMIYMGWA
jgi:hypothetical protein